MNKKILYKLLLIFALLACTLLITNTKSFASDETTTEERTSFTHTTSTGKKGTTTNTDILAHNIFIIELESAGGSFGQQSYMLLSTGEFAVFLDEDNTIRISSYDKEGNTIPFYSRLFYDSAGGGMAVTDMSKWTLASFSTQSGSIGLNSDYIDNGEKTLSDLYFYSDYNIYLYDTENQCISNNLLYTSSTGAGDFFQIPPQVMEQVGTLAPIVEGVETKKTLAEVVGILPVVLVVIVGLLAMRKAIRFLMRILKQG